MKSLLLFLSLLLWNCSVSYCSNLGDLYQDVREETKFTLLKSVSPAYFYDWHYGISRAGVSSSLFTYRFLSADAGWSTEVDAKRKGVVLLGGNFHADKFCEQILPLFTEVVRATVPNSMRNFWNKLTLGIYLGHNLDANEFSYGLYSGLEIDF